MRGRARVVEGRAHVRDRRQHLPIDLDEGGGVLGHITAVGDHDDDGIADDAHLLLRQHVLHADLLDRGVGYIERQALLAASTSGRSAHVHTACTPGSCLRWSRIDRADAGVRMRAAREGCVQRVGGCEIVDELSLPGEQRRVLLALHRRPEPAAALGLSCLFHAAPTSSVPASVLMP